MKHFLSIEELSTAELKSLLVASAKMKRGRAKPSKRPLSGQFWAMIFSKASTRTRVSFEVGIRELGGQVVFLPATEIQLGRGEPIKNPVTGADYRVRIDIPDGFEYSLAEIGRGWNTVSRPMQFTLADSYAQFAHVNLCQSGIVR